MADLSGILSFGTGMMQALPQMFFFLQVTGYLFLILFFSKIVMMGFRTFSPRWLRFLIGLGFGAVSLVCGIGISSLIDMNSLGMIGTFLSISMVDVFIGGLIASFILMAGVFLVSRNIFNIKGIEKAIEKLEERLKKAKIGAKNMGGDRVKNPQMIAGVAIIAGLVLFSMYNFHGMPSVEERMFSAMGINPEDFKNIADQAGRAQDALNEITKGANPDCQDFLSLFQPNSDRFNKNEMPEYNNPGIVSIIEQNSGSRVVKMYRVDSNGETYGFAVTETMLMCYAKQGTFCQCIDTTLLSQGQ